MPLSAYSACISVAGGEAEIEAAAFVGGGGADCLDRQPAAAGMPSECPAEARDMATGGLGLGVVSSHLVKVVARPVKAASALQGAQTFCRDMHVQL